MHNCTEMPCFCKSPRMSRSVPRLPTVNNTAPERRQGAENRRTLEGEIRRTELFCPTTTDPIPVFSLKMSPRRREGFVFDRRTLSYPSKGAIFLRETQCRTEIPIPSHDKMAAVDSFDTKKFFFSFPDRPWRGRGRTITPCVKTPPLLAAGGAHAPPEAHQFKLVFYFSSHSTLNKVLYTVLLQKI